MEISAKVLADSVNSNGIRITTLELHYHRYILPEVNTHRAISKNGASSRAIPTAKLIDNCLLDRVEPLEWGLNQAGMQAFTVADPILEAEGREIWDDARDDAIRHAIRLNEKGFAKQIVNRVLEPFLSTRTIITSTDWANLEALRNHKDAQPEFRELAVQIIRARKNSKPRVLGTGEWHLPYILPEDHERVKAYVGSQIIADIGELLVDMYPWIVNDTDILLLMVSAARCARVTARTLEGGPTDFEKDLELFQRLVKAQPVHASPTEHQATEWPGSTRHHMTANFRGFTPFRRLIKGETVRDTI